MVQMMKRGPNDLDEIIDRLKKENKRLKKVYNEKTVLKGLNLTIHKGEVYGFIGMNASFCLSYVPPIIA